MELILAAVHDAGFSAQSVGFGMGGGLLQKVSIAAFAWFALYARPL